VPRKAEYTTRYRTAENRREYKAALRTLAVALNTHKKQYKTEKYRTTAVVKRCGVRVGVSLYRETPAPGTFYSFVTSRVDQCNAVLSGATKSATDGL